MKERILLVADDFTGGNAVAAGFASLGYRAVTVMEDQFSSFEELPAQFDAIVVSTGTRHSNFVDAGKKVRDVLARRGRPRSISFRVDSTLRGPIAATVHAALDVIREETRRHAVAICVFAHPEAGRHTVNGHQYLGEIKLDETELAREALNPISSSDVLKVMEFRGQRCGLISMDVVSGDRNAFHAKLAEMVSAHDVVVVDASLPVHLVAIALAVAELAEDMEILTVDPGPFSVELARVRSLRRATSSISLKSILAVIGSPSELTGMQIEHLKSTRSISTITVDFDHSGGLLKVGKPSTVEVTSAADTRDQEIIVLSATNERGRHEMATDAADRIARNLAAIARDLMEECDVGAVFCTGGDMTEALLSHFGAWGVEVEEEVIPLAVSGTVAGGSWDGLPIVTKGGMVGDSDSVLRCIAALESRMTKYHPTLQSTKVLASDRVEEPND